MGFRIEAVDMDTTRISVLWSLSPCGNIALSSYFSDFYISQIISAFPGLRDMINQIPRYHIHNLVDQIRQTQRDEMAQQSSSHIKNDICEPQEPITKSQTIEYPCLSNTIQHFSQSSDRVNRFSTLFN